MAYYDSIAEHWHAITGDRGDAFKELVLNNRLLEQIASIENQAILELGAGNGYFWPLALRHFADQQPASLTVTDESEQQLDIARRYFEIPGAHYQRLDVSNPFPFDEGQFDLILASMVFNEISTPGFKHALHECWRVLRPEGHLLMTVTHPAFIERLQKSGTLQAEATGGLTMPGAGSLRLPVAIRSVVNYRRTLQVAGFAYSEEECYATTEVVSVKAGLRNAWKVPIALIYTCTKSS